MRIALLTTESTASAEAAARVLRGTAQEVVFLGLSDPMRGGVGRLVRLLRRSGPGLLPWLVVEFAAPRLFRPKGAGPVAAAAQARGVAPRVLGGINDAPARAALAAARPDLIVTCHFDQILAPETIAIAPLGGVNLHPSLLPRHRGPMPCFWCAAESGAHSGVSVHRLAARIDAGALLAQQAVAPPPGATVSAAARALHLAGAEVLLQAIEDIAAGRETERESAPLPYCPFPDRAAMRAARGRGVRLTDAADWRAARALGGVAG
jgi:hypothetical protein